MATKTKMKFLDVFSEEKGDVLVTKVKIKVREETFEKDVRFSKGEKIAGIDFHILRYLDLVVEVEEGSDLFSIVAVMSPSK